MPAGSDDQLRLDTSSMSVVVVVVVIVIVNIIVVVIVTVPSPLSHDSSILPFSHWSHVARDTVRHGPHHNSSTGHLSIQ